MKKLIFILLFPIFMFSQECYTVKEITSSAQIEEMNQKRITFGIKQMAEELISERYQVCQDGKPVIIDVYSIEAPSKGLSLGPFAKKKKETIVKIKLSLGDKRLAGDGLAAISTQSMFLDLNDENLPFNKTSFASAIKKALESALN